MGVTKGKIAIIICLLISMAMGIAMAAPQLSYQKEERFDSYVTKPLLAGMDNAFVQDSINAGIEQEGNYAFLLATLRALADAQQSGLKVDSTALLLGPDDAHTVLSLRVDQAGRIGPGRPGYAIQPMMFRLSSGEPVSAADIFTDVAAAQAALELEVVSQVVPDMSNYLDASSLLPLPIDRLMLDEVGVNFFYHSEQLALLSGWPASLHFTYAELAELLQQGEGSLLHALGIRDWLTLNQENAQRVAQAVSQGMLPGLPVQLGQAVSDIRASHPLMVDPEAFPGGSKLQLEDGRFRGVVLTVNEGETALGGIISRRFACYGLVAGSSARQDVLAALGEPGSSLQLDQAAAERYGLLPGLLDSYQHGDNQLSLSYDASGLLRALWLQAHHQ